MSLAKVLAGICILWSMSCFGRNVFTHTVEDVNDRNDWKAFFNPKIKVNISIGCGVYSFGTSTDKVLYPGDCKYVCPQNVNAFRKRCVKSGNALKPDNNKGVIPCICAFTITSCDNKTANTIFNGAFAGLIGCFDLPLSPPPPPFCNNAAHLTQQAVVSIVPIKGSSFWDPKIKGKIGKDNQKKCADGSKVKINDLCLDGSLGEIVSYQEVVVGAGESKSITYNGEFYSFSAKKENGQVCASCIDGSKNVIKEQCYDYIELADPVIKSHHGDKVSITIDGYKNNRTFDIKYGKKHQESGMSLIKPKFDKDGNVVYDKKGNIQEDKNGKMFCINRDYPVNDYSITRNKKSIRFRLIDKTFIPAKYSSTIQAYVIDDDSHRHSISIENTDQNILDTVQLNDAGFMLIRPHVQGQEHFKYLLPFITMKNGDQTQFVEWDGKKIGKPLVLRDDERKNMRLTDPKVRGLCFDVPIPATPLTPAKPKPAPPKPTPPKPTPPKPTTPSGGGKKPHTGGGNTSVNYVDIQGDLSFLNINYKEYREYRYDIGPKKCSVVTVEAWGGGRLAYQHGVVYGGSSGSYTKAKIRLGNKTYFKVEFYGGDGSNRPVGYRTADHGAGEDVVVSLCDPSYGNCDVLLIAAGGNWLNSSKGEVRDSRLFDVEVLSGVHDLKRGKSSGTLKVAVPQRLPDPPKINGKDVKYPSIKNHYVAFKDTNCNDSSKFGSMDFNTLDCDYSKRPVQGDLYCIKPSDIPGMGGCVTLDGNGLQDGGRSFVRLTCD